MKIDITIEEARKIEGVMVEEFTDYVDYESKVHAHSREVWQVGKCKKFDETYGMWRYEAYNYQDQRPRDYLLDPITIKCLLRRGCEVLRSGTSADDEEKNNVVGKKITRVVSDTITKVYEGAYLCREFLHHSTDRDDETETHHTQDLHHFVDIYKVKEITYDPKEVVYHLLAYSLSRGEMVRFYYLPDDVYLIVDRPSLSTRVKRVKDTDHCEEVMEYSYLLPETIPTDLLDKGMEWFLGDEGMRWLTETRTPNLLKEGAKPQPVPQGESKEVRVNIPPTEVVEDLQD